MMKLLQKNSNLGCLTSCKSTFCAGEYRYVKERSARNEDVIVRVPFPFCCDDIVYPIRRGCWDIRNGIASVEISSEVRHQC